jgi:hypothetical protein
VEGTVTGIAYLPVGQKDLEKSLALDGQVERVAGSGEVALGLDDFCFRGPSTETYLQTRRDRGLLGCGGAGHDFILIQKVSEIDLTLLKPRGTGVGEIVSDVVQIQLLSGHPTGGRVEGTKHIRFLSQLVEPAHFETASTNTW